eukprot:CAMPEP_0168621150 /NCGR_PEP_ID=MMETSP0449_2-20121227/7533_1 /TAXON_ID=1082188 /ORGANISM="Strombidium rassoulzadegani, Strain ras09" /LENGTH=219 /DNA_ID=CAMNT_0008662235 /DNA_START=447 /DNA_END=1102 /DNA_ORIENTATION=-
MMIQRELAPRTRKPKDGKRDIKETMQRIANRTRRFQDLSVESKSLIAHNSQNVLRDGMTILVHGVSECVLNVLKSSHSKGVRIQVIFTQSAFDREEDRVLRMCNSHNIPCKLVKEAAIGLCMDQVDAVFVGAEVVLENGGIVNKLGTFTIALCAKSFNKPFYVFAESLKFLKNFPLQQDDIFDLLDEDLEATAPRTDISNISIDYTQPEYISNLFTDIG